MLISKMHKKYLQTNFTNMSRVEEAKKCMYTSHFLAHFLQIFQRFWNQHEILRFLYLFWFVQIVKAHFLNTLNANATETNYVFEFNIATITDSGFFVEENKDFVTYSLHIFSP